MDALDGGMWNYGDSSFPAVGVTYFAGTFVRHPLALAAAWAVLNHLKQSGPSLQTHLNERTAELVRTLNAYAEKVEAPIRLTHFSSWFYVNFAHNFPLASLFFVLMREKGVHIWEARPCFLTTAHTHSDLEHVIRAFKESVAEMQEAEFLPATRSAAVATKGIAQDEAKEASPFALTDAQSELWLAAQMADDASRAFIDSAALRIRGPFRMAEMVKAIQKLVARHDSLRTTFSENGEKQHVATSVQLHIPFTDLSDLKRNEREKRLVEIAAKESQRAARSSLRLIPAGRKNEK